MTDEATLALRELLFCDAAFAELGVHAPALPAWGKARALAERGDRSGAETALRAALAGPESRVRLQTWALLRSLGVEPSREQSEEVLGVIVENGSEEGFVTLAAYADGEARMFFSTGGGVIGETREQPAVAEAARQVVASAQAIEVRLPMSSDRSCPADGDIAVRLLTPAGIHIAVAATTEAMTEGHPLFPVVAASMGPLATNLLRLLKS